MYILNCGAGLVGTLSCQYRYAFLYICRFEFLRYGKFERYKTQKLSVFFDSG